MKRGLGILILVLLILPFVSAAGEFEQARDILAKVLDSALGFLTPVLEKVLGDFSSSEFFFTKVLILILLILIIRAVLDKTPLGEDNPKVSILLALIVSVLAVRFMSQNKFIESVLIPYGTLGVAIVTILPMVIFFYFIHNTKVGTFGRKVFWAIYGITLFVLWISRSRELPATANWIYILSFIAIVIFIFMDKSIHGYFGMHDFDKYSKELNEKRIWELKEELYDLGEKERKGVITSKEYKKKAKKLKRDIKEFS